MKRAQNMAVLPRRKYGTTGIELSVIGFGGIVVKDMPQPDANRIVAEAVERGVNYFDVAPAYGDAEERLGPALEPYRRDVFLACKTTERTREGAAADLARSLERLRTDYLDLYQLHGLRYRDDDEVDAVFSKGGAFEVFLEAKREGRVRHLGFSAHSEEAALLAMDRYDFDSVLFPFNFACWYRSGFGQRVWNRAGEKGVACLALKALARQQWPENDPLREEYSKCWYQPVTDRDEARLALRFTLSLPVTAAVSPGEESLLRLALDVVADLEPLTPDEERELKTLAANVDPIFSAS